MVRKKFIIGALSPDALPIYITREYPTNFKFPELLFNGVQYYLTRIPLQASKWVDYKEAENFLMGFILAGNEVDKEGISALFFIEPVYHFQF